MSAAEVSDKVKGVTFRDQQHQGGVFSERSRLATVTPTQYATCSMDPGMAIEYSLDNDVMTPCNADVIVTSQSRAARAKHYVRRFLIFVFSTAGMSVLLALYVCLGGIIFLRIEEPGEVARRERARGRQEDAVFQLWQLVDENNVFHPELWRKQARAVLLNYTLDVYGMGQDDAFNTDPANTLKWNYPNALLYSITIITTIGYGHITTKSPEGQMATVIYAIIGIPLNFITIANLGTHMAIAFRFLYKNVFCRRCLRYHDEHLTISSAVRRLNTSIRHAYKNSGRSSSGASSSCIDTTHVTSTPTRCRPKVKVAANGHDVIVQVKGDDESLVISLWVPVLIMLTYVMLGAALFQQLEAWDNYMIGFYFCFVTLTTIGLGDYVPGNAFKSPTHMLILCIVYVFFGLALIAMCFDLVQHEVRMKFRALGRRMGFIEPKVNIIDATPVVE